MRLRKPLRRFKQNLPSILLAVAGITVAITLWQLRTPVLHHTVELMARAIDARVQAMPVSGAQYVSQSGLKSAIALTEGDSLVGYDVAEARKRIEQLPWVYLAAVERRLPHTLAVELYEYAPIARVALTNDEWVIDKTGHRIAPTDERFAHLPLIQGDEAADHAAGLFALLQGFATIQQELSSAVWVGKRRWDLTLKSGITLQLPEKSAENALSTLLELNEKRELLTLSGGEVDLRLDDRVVLRIPPGVEPVPAK